MGGWFNANVLIYFDHNATSPLHPVAQAAWLQAIQEFPANPSSPHRLGARADAALTQARQKLAQILGCSPLDIIWTSGASESNNMALHHLASTLPTGTEVWISAIEHPSVLEPARRYFHGRIRSIPVTGDGCVDLDWIENALTRSRPGLVVLMAANNETGVLQPWRDARTLCKRHALPIFCDAVQWIGRLPAAGLGACDFVSGSAHKFGGPRGVGFLKCPSGVRIEPLIYGGPQEEGRRAGTENVAGVLAMIAMLEARETALAAGQDTVRKGQQAAFEAKLEQILNGVNVIGRQSHRLWNTTAVIMPKINCRQRWVVKLDKLGFAVSTGSACSSGKEVPSHVLLAMGYPAAEAGRALRLSSSWETTESDWDQLRAALKEAYRSMLGN